APPIAARNARRSPARTRGSRAVEARPGPDDGMPWLARCPTDAFGDFRFRDLRAGTEYELRVDVPMGGRLQFLGRRVVRAGPMERPVRCDWPLATGLLQITCSSGSRPCSGRMVRLRQVLPAGNEGACCELLLDGNGQSLLDGLPLGNWTIEPMHGGRCEPAEFELLAGQAPSLLFQVLAR
ncbi:MAG: hypothetical protein WAT39_08770, partial [Planctomycetota bacterium]